MQLRATEAIARQRAQLLNEIVWQGIQEGSFVVAHPDKAGEVIMALLQAMGDRHAETRTLIYPNKGYLSNEGMTGDV